MSVGELVHELWPLQEFLLKKKITGTLHVLEYGKHHICPFIGRE